MPENHKSILIVVSRKINFVFESKEWLDFVESNSPDVDLHESTAEPSHPDVCNYFFTFH
jgi:hypothetical protein